MNMPTAEPAVGLLAVSGLAGIVDSDVMLQERGELWSNQHGYDPYLRHSLCVDLQS